MVKNASSANVEKARDVLENELEMNPKGSREFDVHEPIIMRMV